MRVFRDDQKSLITRINIVTWSMVIVFFVHTVDTQNAVLDDEGEPDHTIYVVGQQWQWTFNYVDEPAVDSPNLANPEVVRHG